MPIRRLMQRVGPTIQKIKPVFLMSPISVAQFLPPGAMEFDLLVIDEASQVRPEDALGVMARAKQMVVVGDSKQLPPTNFFNRLLSDDDIDEDSDSDASAETDALAGAARAAELESVLTLCEARGVNTKMLRWHYRSRHPSLIEVSNEVFYGRSLFLPPSPVNGRDGEGFVLKRVLGAYDRGGKRTNEIEAKAILEALIDHAGRNPDKSAGIVTFSTAQRDLILNLIDEARRRESVLDSFLGDQADETFVKNLENVQGDERDHIFVSIGYGPRIPGGKLDSMNFGPVSTDSGQRRLNVLFTRARHRCEVICSFEPADIDTNRATSEGVKVLKRFLTYAETGVLDQPALTGRDYDSPFEEDVARVIASLGFLADSQVGTAGFKIDLGVRDPEYPGRYILAVECDGAAYHGALWARERDRLRQEVLESQGWRFHRIWSTDWFYRRPDEIKRLKTVLEAARAKQDRPQAAGFAVSWSLKI
jgi:superfamily I DNA and/or RNA helicase